MQVVSPFIGQDVNYVITDKTEWGGAAPSSACGSPLFGTPKPSPLPSPLPPLFSPAASPAGNSRGSNFSPSTLDSPSESYGGGRRHPVRLKKYYFVAFLYCSSKPSITNLLCPVCYVFQKSRAEAMLERVRSQPQVRTRDPLVDAQSWGLTIWSVETVSTAITLHHYLFLL